MPQSAVLLMDLQVDFLAPSGARMPVAPEDAVRVIDTANAVLSGEVLSTSLPILIVNQFPRSARLANFFRHGAAIEGSPGAKLDERIHAKESTPVFPKNSASAFSNPKLNTYLKSQGVLHLHVFGVFAEGCVRATALEAKQLGYTVTVPLDAIGTDANFKRGFARWSMQRAGVALIPTLLDAKNAT
jgi:nicotinamidase-related amidase